MSSLVKKGSADGGQQSSGEHWVKVGTAAERLEPGFALPPIPAAKSQLTLPTASQVSDPFKVVDASQKVPVSQSAHFFTQKI